MDVAMTVLALELKIVKFIAATATHESFVMGLEIPNMVMPTSDTFWFYPCLNQLCFQPASCYFSDVFFFYFFFFFFAVCLVFCFLLLIFRPFYF